MTLNHLQQALVVSEKGQPPKVVSNKPIPSISAGEVLVRVKAVTLNPTDWKHVERILKPGDSIGCDFAGEIVEVGADAKEKGFKIGDSVAGFVRAGVDENNGAFQEYVKTLPALIWHKPASLPYEDAASMGGIALSTAVQALFYRLDVPKPWDPASKSPDGPIIVWAGSTSVGLSAISLIKLSNPSTPIISTASPHNHALLKSRGVDAVFDYRDPDVVNKIKTWVAEHGYEDGVEKAFDTISEHGSTKLVADSLGKNGGRIVTLIPVSEEEKASWPSNVLDVYILLYGVLDPANQKDHTDIQEWNAHITALISDRGLTNPVPLKISQGGLKAILEGLSELRAGKVSARDRKSVV